MTMPAFTGSIAAHGRRVAERDGATRSTASPGASRSSSLRSVACPIAYAGTVRRRPSATFGRVVVRGIGEVLITLGLVLLLMLRLPAVVDQRGRQGDRRRREPDRRRSTDAPVAAAASRRDRHASPPRSARHGLSRCCSSRGSATRWVRPVIQGIGLTILAKGAGHYREARRCRGRSATSPSPRTARPTASRSATSTTCEVGDKIYVQTKEPGTRTRVTRTTDRRARRDVWVIAPSPASARRQTDREAHDADHCTPAYARRSGSSGPWLASSRRAARRPTARPTESPGPPDPARHLRSVRPTAPTQRGHRVYAWIWRKLPGPWPVEAARSLAVLVADRGAAVHRGLPLGRAAAAVLDNTVDGDTTAGRARPDPVAQARQRHGPRSPRPGRADYAVRRGLPGTVGSDVRAGRDLSPRMIGSARMMRRLTRILVVDNYDSFVFNLVQYLAQLGADVDVRRNDAVEPDRGAGLRRRAALARPGHARGGRRLHRRWSARCAGARRRCSASASGTRRSAWPTARRSWPRAGAAARQDLARCTTTAPGVLAGLPDPFTATRYHSLALEPGDAARRARGHRARPSPAWSWRCATATLPSRACSSTPRVVLTEGGHRMLANWLVRVRRPRRRAALEPGLAPVVAR